MKRTLILVACLLALASPIQAQVAGWPIGVTPPVFVIGGGFISGAGVANGPIFAPAGGSCAAGSIPYSFTGDSNSGYGSNGPDGLLLCVNGTNAVLIDATQAFFGNAIIATFRVSGIATTSTDSLILANTLNATGGATVQMSPRIKWRGNAWDTAASQTVDFFAEVLPATAATPTGLWKLGFSLNGGAATYPFQVRNDGTTTVGLDLFVGTNRFLLFGTSGGWRTTADKQMTLVDNGTTTGMELNVGTPTLGTCTGGTLVSGAHNFGGEVTGNTSGSCVINFGTPNFTNTPFCFINDETTLTAVRISARSTSSITVTGAVSGDAFQFFCIGRIGT